MGVTRRTTRFSSNIVGAKGLFPRAGPVRGTVVVPVDFGFLRAAEGERRIVRRDLIASRDRWIETAESAQKTTVTLLIDQFFIQCTFAHRRRVVPASD